MILDVRTPSEYHAEHLEGAVNIDWQDPQFRAEVSLLPRDDEYRVYCRSGHRAGLATDTMKALGFTDVVSLGGLEAAAEATGKSIVSR